MLNMWIVQLNEKTWITKTPVSHTDGMSIYDYKANMYDDYDSAALDAELYGGKVYQLQAVPAVAPKEEEY